MSFVISVLALRVFSRRRSNSSRFQSEADALTKPDLRVRTLTDEGAPPKCQMQPGQ